jgi:hypothetical protein
MDGAHPLSCWFHPIGLIHCRTRCTHSIVIFIQQVSWGWCAPTQLWISSNRSHPLYNRLHPLIVVFIQQVSYVWCTPTQLWISSNGSHPLETIVHPLNSGFCPTGFLWVVHTHSVVDFIHWKPGCTHSIVVFIQHVCYGWCTHLVVDFVQ